MNAAAFPEDEWARRDACIKRFYRSTERKRTRKAQSKSDSVDDLDQQIERDTLEKMCARLTQGMQQILKAISLKHNLSEIRKLAQRAEADVLKIKSDGSSEWDSEPDDEDYSPEEEGESSSGGDDDDDDDDDDDNTSSTEEAEASGGSGSSGSSGSKGSSGSSGSSRKLGASASGSSGKPSAGASTRKDNGRQKLKVFPDDALAISVVNGTATQVAAEMIAVEQGLAFDTLTDATPSAGSGAGAVDSDDDRNDDHDTNDDDNGKDRALRDLWGIKRFHKLRDSYYTARKKLALEGCILTHQSVYHDVRFVVFVF